MNKLIVIKREGSKAPYSAESIIVAVSLAAESFVSSESARRSLGIKVENKVGKKLIGQTEVSIYEIEKLVENELMKMNGEVARSYIEYRHDRDVAREKNTQIYKDITGLIEQTDKGILNENANKDAKTIPTQRDLLAGIVAKAYAKNHILPQDVVLANELGQIHYHDLDYAPFTKGMFNCMLVDLEGMLSHGFKMGNAEIETPKSIRSAAEITAQIISQVASNIYGGTTIHRIDQVLAPYVKMSADKYREYANEFDIPEPDKFVKKLTEKECYDAMQHIEYHINSMQTSNGQCPFVTYGISGFDTSEEARLLTKCIFKVRIAGLGKKRKTAVFPKLVYTLRDGYNVKPTDPNYDLKQLAVECATKRMYPDILNYENIVEITGSYKTPMGCRSFLGVYLDENGNEAHEGRNNLGVVSLNLPRIGIEANKDFGKFWSILEHRLEVCRKALMTRIERFEGVTADSAPILYMNGACGIKLDAKDEVMSIFKDGRSSISLGYIGVHELANAMFGTETETFSDSTRKQFTIDVIQKLRDKCDLWKKETGFAFSLYSTPSENLCNRFASIDTKAFGVIEGVTDHEYYTNSFHLCVTKKVNPFEKLTFEAPYQSIANGGFISYVELPSMQKNPLGLEAIWDFSRTIGLGYVGTNSPIDECYECGFKGEFKCTSKGFQCPDCGNHDPKSVSVTRRVCGYLGSPDARPFNRAKQVEVLSRVKHQ